MINLRTLTKIKERFVKLKSSELMAITTSGFMASGLLWGPLPANAVNVFSHNLYFVSTTGGYSSPDTTPPGSTVITGGFTSAGTGTTNSVNLAAIGVTPAEASSVTVQGKINYTGSADASVIANLLANSVVVQSFTLASGTTSIAPGTSFSIDFSSGVQANFNQDLAIQFIGTGTTLIAGHDVRVVAVPWETDVLSVVGSTVIFAGATWLKRRRKNP